jgi:cytochrome oxidase Cu insertion factor (SCO1/SenC/PrrC family)
MKNTVFGFWIATLASVAVAYGAYFAYRSWQHRSEVRFPDESAAPRKAVLNKLDQPSFTLTERSGKSFDSSTLAGKVWVVSFFYSNCPGPCLKQNQALAAAAAELADRDVRFVSITCDPAVDTPERLREYAARFQADPERWLFLTGNLDTIKEISGKQFLLNVDRQTHSERAIVIGRDGKIRDIFATLDPLEMQQMKKLLTELTEEDSAGQS